MIGMKISWNLDSLKRMMPDIVDGAQKNLGKPMLDAVKKEMSIGKSPVEGRVRYVAYSPSYTADIKGGTVHKRYPGKRVRPVNLFLSGKMYASAFVAKTYSGLMIGFKDIKATYHNTMGAGKSRVKRRMLPTESGETFSRTIMQKALKVLQVDIIKRVVNKVNRK